MNGDEVVRIYYNRRSDAPYVWSFDYGTQATERKVTGFRVVNCLIADGQDPTVVEGDTERPRVWLEAHGAVRVEVKFGVAHVYGAYGT